MDMSQAQAWMAIIGVVFTGLTGLITLFFAALASRGAKRSREMAQESKGALTEIHTVVNDNFSKQREEIAAQARAMGIQASEIMNLRNLLANSKLLASEVESARVALAAEAAAALAAPPPPR